MFAFSNFAEFLQGRITAVSTMHSINAAELVCWLTHTYVYTSINEGIIGSYLQVVCGEKGWLVNKIKQEEE